MTDKERADRLEAIAVRRRMLAGKNYLNNNPDLGAIASITIEKLKNREKEEKHDED